jgi:hypothetical protein
MCLPGSRIGDVEDALDGGGAPAGMLAGWAALACSALGARESQLDAGIQGSHLSTYTVNPSLLLSLFTE